MPNDLTIRPDALPDNINDLSSFVLVGREKLNAVRAEIRAIDRVQLAKDVRDQKQEEARMLSEALLDAEVKLGEIQIHVRKIINHIQPSLFDILPQGRLTHKEKG